MIIGITGSIGSGKSYVSSIFKDNGFYTIDCDKVSHSIDEIDEYVLQIKNTFGDDVITDGKINRKKLAEVAFASKENLKKLEDISHPIILKQIEIETEKALEKGMICVYDAPTLFQSGLDKKCDITIGVLADKEQRIERAIIRGGLSEKEIIARVLMQPDNDYYIKNCTYVVENNGTYEDLVIEVNKLINTIKKGE